MEIIYRELEGGQDRASEQVREDTEHYFPDHKAVTAYLLRMAKLEDWQVIFQTNLRNPMRTKVGVCLYDLKRIIVGICSDREDMIATLCHEVIHALRWHLKPEDYLPTSDQEEKTVEELALRWAARIKENQREKRTPHGLHVLNNEFVDGCEPCEERRRIMTTAVLLGIEPKKAVSDATIARELVK